ncbi:hypothetical protein M9H77_21011 [Catharanthus roseus]|uniref:Uncharacterized protein n=1 Tax=Catharanthus roseus TaxID=4058 RepID=A0ACC0AQH0_CATRO|nr:hypothetical protein M9H77_21011 [Catharanthus roseus]
MEEDRSWMYRRTMPRVMGISSEFQLGVKWKYTKELMTCFPSLTESDIQTRINDEFSMWFREEMEKVVNTSNNECLKSLSWGLFKRFIHMKEVLVVLHITVVYRLKMVCGSKKSAHLAVTSTMSASTSVKTSTTPVETASPPKTSFSMAAASTPPGTSYPLPSDCSKVIIEIMKAHFVEAHPGFGKSSRKGREDGRGLHTVRTVCPTTSAERKAKYQEMKTNMEKLHIETGSPILTEEQLMFEVASGSNKDHVYGFGSKSTVVTVERRGGSSSSMSSVPSISFTASHKAYIERERRLWGYM